jgi:hypothetical protein
VDPFFLALGLAFVDGALGNAVSGVCVSGLDRGLTLMHSSHEESIAELGSSYTVSHYKQDPLYGVSARKSWGG